MRETVVIETPAPAATSLRVIEPDASLLIANHPALSFVAGNRNGLPAAS
jgi:hypothetical protein